MSEHDSERGAGNDATSGQADDGRKRKRKRRGGRSRRGQAEGQADSRGDGRRDDGAPGRSGPPRRRRSRSEARTGESRSEPRTGESRSEARSEARPEARSGESRSEGRSGEGRTDDAGRERRRRRRRRRDAGPDSAPAAAHGEAAQDDADGSRGEGKRSRRRRRRGRERDGTEPARRSRRGAHAREADSSEPLSRDRAERDMDSDLDRDPRARLDALPGRDERDHDDDHALERGRFHAPGEPHDDLDDDDDDVLDGGSSVAADEDDAGFFAGLDPSDAVAVPEPGADDPDPASFGIEDLEVDERAALATGVRNLVGVKFSAAGRIYIHDSGDQHYQRGEDVVVEGERGTRVGTVAVPSVRQTTRKQSLPRVLRRPNPSDRRAQERGRERGERALELARSLSRSLALPMKVFRASHAHSGKKVTIYFTSEERIDFRELVRRLTAELHCRIEMRQTGVRDEAKYVGGIGSCGRELCCTTWLPEFVPVSIKMAKVQGMVLNPTKVSGQCGRLKCCLVYEQATYAEMRKGLPKLGKRVITEDGEGRVVEVDVLRQRVRVALGPGEFRVFAGHEVKPMFPSQPGKPTRQ